MNKLAMSMVATLLAGLCAWHVRRLWGWTNTDAVSQAPEHQMWTYTGQKLPITYNLPDGRQVESSLRLDGKSGIPRRGSRIRIIYDPSSPTDVTRAWTPLLLAAGVAAMLFVAVALWVS